MTSVHSVLSSPVMSGSSQHLRGVTITVIGVLILTPDSLLIRLIHTDAWTLLFWRGLLQFASLAVYYAATHRQHAAREFTSAGRMGLLIGITYALGNILFIHSIRTTSVSNTLLIVSSVPMIAAVLSRIFLRERTARHTWLAAAASMAGVAIIFSGGWRAGSFHGDALAFVSAVCMAASFVLIRHARVSNMIPAVAIAGLFIALFALPSVTTLSVSARDAFLLFLLGGVIVPFAFALITLGPRYITAPEVSLIMLIETVLGPTWVWVFLGETPPAMTYVGGAVVVAALVTHSIISLRRGDVADA